MAAPEAGSCLPMINRALPGITTTQLPGVPCTASPTSALSSTSTPSPWSATTAPSAMSSLLSSPATVMPVALAQPPLGKKKLPRFSIDTSPVAGVAPSPHTNAAIAVAANETVPAALTSLNLNDVLQPSNHPSTPAAALPPFSQIRPYLLLGDDSIPTSPDAVERLKDMGVTHVLNMAKEVDPACGLGRDDQGIVYKSLGIWDDPDQEGVADVVKAGVAFIDHARATHPNPLILVHCKAGRSRSVMIVMAHLIKSERLSLQASYDDVRNKRSGIVPNIGFMVTLMKFEKEMLEECA
ncbi:protein-tyrosine phosphatase-like protein [Zopfochytrium polystomum]|nr:protein-tyrosine phosphatase-like protein [Zopfochytrium polystomum]